MVRFVTEIYENQQSIAINNSTAGECMKNGSSKSYSYEIHLCSEQV